MAELIKRITPVNHGLKAHHQCLTCLCKCGYEFHSQSCSNRLRDLEVYLIIISLVTVVNDNDKL